MRNAFLVAWRDFAESAKTKGFWIGLLLFPIIILLAIQVPQFLEKKGAPQRYFVLVDQSGEYEELISNELEDAHYRRVLRSLGVYAAKNVSIEKFLDLATAELNREITPEPKGVGAGGLISGLLGGKMSGLMETARKRALENALKEFDRDNIELIEKSLGMLASLDSSQIEKAINQQIAANPALLDALRQPGGKARLVEAVRSIVHDDAEAYEEPRRKYVKVDLPAGVDGKASFQDLGAALKPYLRGGKKIQFEGQPSMLYAAILISKDVNAAVAQSNGAGGGEGVEYWASNLADLELHNDIRNRMNREVRTRAFAEKGMDINDVRKIEQTEVPFAKLNPKKEAGQEKVSQIDMIRQWAPSGFVYLLWIAIFTVSQMLLSNTIEEKSNRIIEVLLSSVTPGELMMGKLAGIAAIGLTMVGTWILSLLGILAWKAGAGVEQLKPILTMLTSSNLLPAFFIYFIFGYLLYAGAILTIGSLCNTLKDAQNYMGVVTVVMMVPMLTMMFIPKDPHGTLAVVLSWIPIYTPFTMMNRAAADPPMFDVVGTMILLIATTALVLWLSGKIFRIGVLRTGQPPKLLELFRWVRDSMKGRG